MVTVIEPTKTERKGAARADMDKQASRHGGGGGGGRRGGGGGHDDRRFSPEPESVSARYKIGLFAALAGIAVMFATLTIPYLWLTGTPMWRPMVLPPLLWLSTALILASSVTFEAALRSWRRNSFGRVPRRLLATMLLGSGFLASQLYCWTRLAAGGTFLESSAHKSFFYILTGLHAAHIIGGVIVIAYLRRRVNQQLTMNAADTNLAGGRPLPRAALEAGALYWHFVGALWVYVFMLLLLWK